ncbi:MAG: phosphohydrolase [Candidatus Shapirobacteria bacterium]
MNRQDFYNAAKTNLDQNIFYHSLALEACMGGIYDYLSSQNQLGPNEPPKDDWLLAGLIHDIDYTAEFKELHPSKTAEALAKHNLTVSDSILQIVKAHGWHYPGGVEPKSLAQWAIFCADSLTGLIVAVALVYPTKKLADVKLSSVTKRFLKELRFAAGTRREDVKLCEKADSLNIPLEKFIEICLVSMQKIALNIGL